MKKEQFQQQLVAYLSGRMNDDQQQAFELFLIEHPEHKQQFDQLRSSWKQLEHLDKIPEPSKRMDEAFYSILHNEIDAKSRKSDSVIKQLQSILAKHWKPQLAFGIVLLAVGMAAGYYLNTSAGVDAVTTTVVNTNETEQVREQLVLTLLEQPSANKRLQAVSEATKLNSATAQIINALFTTLNKDPNVNVRLAAVESLSKYVKKPEVRMGLIKSISKQESPLVQIALADLMVKLQEKSSVNPMKQLLEKPDIDTTVKQKIEESINHII